MPNTTDKSWKEGLQKLWYRVRLIAAFTSPIWIVALLMPSGSLGRRLLGAGLLLIISLAALLPLRWLVYGAGFLAALGQRQEEKKKGELEDAKKY